VAVQHQKTLLSTASPKYILDLPLLHLMLSQMQHVNDVFSTVVSNLTEQQQSLIAAPSNASQVRNVSRGKEGGREEEEEGREG
jgi:hypothetical protein